MTRPHPVPGGSSTGAGTAEPGWRRWLTGRGWPGLDPAALGGEVLVCSAHPDDDVLGAGALLAAAAAAGTRVRLLAATDGEASHPGSRVLRPPSWPAAGSPRPRPPTPLSACGPSSHPAGSARRRRRGRGVPAGRRAGRRRRGVDAVLAPWVGDAHPDHDAVGPPRGPPPPQLGVPLLAYPVWAWEWAAPGDPRLPWDAAVLGRPRRGRPRGQAAGGGLLRHPGSAPGPGSRGRRRAAGGLPGALRPRGRAVLPRPGRRWARVTLPPSYFEDMYAAAEDPWSMRTRWYEQRKYALTAAALPRARYGEALRWAARWGSYRRARRPLRPADRLGRPRLRRRARPRPARGAAAGPHRAARRARRPAARGRPAGALRGPLLPGRRRPGGACWPRSRRRCARWHAGRRPLAAPGRGLPAQPATRCTRRCGRPWTGRGSPSTRSRTSCSTAGWPHRPATPGRPPWPPAEDLW